MLDVRISDNAQADITEVLRKSTVEYGVKGRKRYERLLVAAIKDIASDPKRAGIIERPELGEGIRSYHLRHSKERATPNTALVKKPRHLILFRYVRDDVIGIGRVLYDSVSLHQHLPTNFGDE